MFPMRSIELSIILLQPVDGSSRNEEGERGGEEGGDANRSPAFLQGRVVVMVNRALRCKCTVLFV